MTVFIRTVHHFSHCCAINANGLEICRTAFTIDVTRDSLLFLSFFFFPRVVFLFCLSFFFFFVVEQKSVRLERSILRSYELVVVMVALIFFLRLLRALMLGKIEERKQTNKQNTSWITFPVSMDDRGIEKGCCARLQRNCTLRRSRQKYERTSRARDRV